MKAFEAIQQWPVLRLDRTTRRLVTICDAALRPVGLTLQQLHLLCHIATREFPVAADLSRLIDVGDGAMCRALRRLEDKGWIRKFESEIGRAFHLELTDVGRRCLEVGLRAATEIQTATEAILDEDGICLEEDPHRGR